MSDESLATDATRRPYMSYTGARARVWRRSQSQVASVATVAACQVCGRAIDRPPCQRVGDSLKFCGLACSGISKRRVAEDELLLIVSARRIGITWPVIAAELGCSVSTLQRAVHRARIAIRLPQWIHREAPGMHHHENADPLQRLRVWLVRCVRHAQGPTAGQAADMIGLAIGEIVRLRAVVERLEGEQREPETIATGRPTRVSGGLR